MFLEISQNSQENTCPGVSFFIKLQAYKFFKKETLGQVFSCDFCEISKNNFFTEHVRTTASVRTRDGGPKIYRTIDIKTYLTNWLSPGLVYLLVRWQMFP